MPFVVTPDQVAGLQRNVNVEVESLYRDIIACAPRLSDNFKTTWRSFASSWSVFYRDNSSTAARMWGNTWDMTQGYATLIIKWRTAFEAQCGRPPTSPGGPLEVPDDTIPEATSLLKNATILAGILGGLWVASKVID